MIPLSGQCNGHGSHERSDASQPAIHTLTAATGVYRLVQRLSPWFVRSSGLHARFWCTFTWREMVNVMFSIGFVNSIVTLESKQADCVCVHPSYSTNQPPHVQCHKRRSGCLTAALDGCLTIYPIEQAQPTSSSQSTWDSVCECVWWGRGSALVHCWWRSARIDLTVAGNQSSNRFMHCITQPNVCKQSIARSIDRWDSTRAHVTKYHSRGDNASIHLLHASRRRTYIQYGGGGALRARMCVCVCARR